MVTKGYLYGTYRPPLVFLWESFDDPTALSSLLFCRSRKNAYLCKSKLHK